MKVLIADDSRSDVRMLEQTLKTRGYEVIVKENGQQVWHALTRERGLRLAVLGWRIPGMDGIEICHRLHTQHRSDFIYVILLTDKEDSGHMAHALRAGASDYITKPFHEEELLARLSVGERIVELQMELAQAQKLESIGQLAAGIAHEINTPTQYVGDNTSFLQDSFAHLLGLLRKYGELLAAVKQGNVSPELVAEVEAAAKDADVEYLAEEIPLAIEHSLEGIDRVSKIVRAMKGFSHPGVEEKTAIDINKAIESTITVARNEWKYVAEMVTEFDAALPSVPCLPADFNQAILNLIINAAHAIADVVGDGSSGKGKITVSTGRNDGWVEIRVSDTGTGVPEAIQGTIFDPFFTTKEVGKGTGQGLAITRSAIVDKHGGSIGFDTKDGGGTTFTVRIPIHPAGAKNEHGDD